MVEKGKEAFSQLTNDNTNSLAFKELTENVYCRVLLLCRKSPGELSRLPVKLYLKVGNKETYEEFSEVLNPTEVILMKKMKRVVIKGKRKSTPVLFSEDVQQHINLLITCRVNFVSEINPYLFCNISKTESTILGYKILAKHAKLAHLAKPEAMTSKRLRKHLATISQLFSMNDQDIEQLSTFMGHSVGVHRSDYRLPDDIFQTAKVMKMLIMMENGTAGQFKGKSFDEIDFNLPENLLEPNPNSELNVSSDEGDE